MAGQFFLAAQSRPVYMAFADSQGPGNPTGSAHCAGPGNGSSRHTVVPLCAEDSTQNGRYKPSWIWLVVHKPSTKFEVLVEDFNESMRVEWAKVMA